MKVACPSCGATNESTAKFCSECGAHIVPLKGEPPNHSPPTQPGYNAPPYAPIEKKFYRSRNNKVFLGVCGGLAKHFDMDPDLVRVITLLLFLFSGGSVLIGYLIAALIFPYDPNEVSPTTLPS